MYGSSYTDVDDILMSDTYNANSTHEETVYTLEFGTSIEKEVHIEVGRSIRVHIYIYIWGVEGELVF